MQCTVFGGAIELVLQKYHHIPVGTCAMIGQLSGTYFPVQPTKFKRVFELEFPPMYLYFDKTKILLASIFRSEL